MPRFHFRWFAPALLIAAPALALLGPVGCADNKSTIFVRHVLAKSEDCLFEPDPNAAFIGQGTIDLRFTDSYSPFLLIGNQLVPQGNSDTLRTETSRVALKGAEVHLTRTTGEVLANFTTIASGTIDPSQGSEPGYGVTQVTMIPPGIGITPGSYIARLTVYGETLGNQEVETGEFVFPIQVCDGCLVFFNKESLDAGQCVPPAGDPVGLCLPGQDGLSDCSLLL